MKLVIDLQGAQGASRRRGIGRLSRSLGLAMARAPGIHEPIILLNEAMPDAAADLYEEFSAILPRANIRTWRGLTGLAATGGEGNMARRRASEVIRAQFITGLDAKLVHVAKGVGDDVVSNWPITLERPPHVATFYDAIPLIHRSQYLDDVWEKWGLTDWYLRQVQELRHCDGLLAISESSRGEAINNLDFDPTHVFNIRAGFDTEVFHPISLEGEVRNRLLGRHGLREGFILFVSAGDLRKNDLGLFQAYALLPKALRMRHQLVIVGAMDPTTLHVQAESLQVSSDELVLLKYVLEHDLPALYSTCVTFVMPSKHEGFGLPALEAMACGAPVIASSTTSLPEVVGCDAALFDPHYPISIANRLKVVLTDATFRADLAAHGLRRAQEFTWKKSARRVWAALEVVQNRQPLRPADVKGAVQRRKPRLACVGPLPPAASGVADYTRDFLPDLARYYDILPEPSNFCSLPLRFGALYVTSEFILPSLPSKDYQRPIPDCHVRGLVQ
jgi:glycosyltransferase involved in cell wall biosynthesis